MRKIKLKQNYKPLSKATPEEWRQAFKIASFWLTDELENCKEFGAFSEANLGESAIAQYTDDQCDEERYGAHVARLPLKR